MTHQPKISGSMVGYITAYACYTKSRAIDYPPDARRIWVRTMVSYNELVHEHWGW